MSRKSIAKSILFELPQMKLSETKKKFLEDVCNKILNGELVEIVKCKDCIHISKCGVSDEYYCADGKKENDEQAN